MSRSIDRVLIAARGVEGLAIARRIEAGGREVVLLMSEEDGARAWVEELPYVVYVPRRDSDRSWPDDARVVHAAQDAGCDAVHPAGGWLNQDATFAERFSRLNTALLSPGPEVLARLTARGALAQVAGASVLAPLPRDLEERQQMRWIEVPVLGDGIDRAMALGDRELFHAGVAWFPMVEAPAPDLSPGLRANLHEQAELVVAKLAVPGPATVRFVVLPGGGVRLMELVPGIQPWFSVTDQVYGLDIVDAQLRIAEGEGLGWSRDSIAPQCSAIWMQITALRADPDAQLAEDDDEADAEADEAPAPEGILVGEVTVPEHGEIVNAVAEGDRVHPVDTLLSVLVHAPTRQAAIVQARHALDQLRVEGVVTTAEGLTQKVTDVEYWKLQGQAGGAARPAGH